jgi:GNAT superfamily N-acetyltransferase
MTATPKYQGKGIGDKILSYFLESADRDALLASLSSFSSSRFFYLRVVFFLEANYADLDLNAWDRFWYRGYSIVAMLWFADRDLMAEGKAMGLELRNPEI